MLYVLHTRESLPYLEWTYPHRNTSLCVLVAWVLYVCLSIIPLYWIVGRHYLILSNEMINPKFCGAQLFIQFIIPSCQQIYLLLFRQWKGCIGWSDFFRIFPSVRYNHLFCVVGNNTIRIIRELLSSFLYYLIPHIIKSKVGNIHGLILRWRKNPISLNGRWPSFIWGVG